MYLPYTYVTTIITYCLNQFTAYNNQPSTEKFTRVYKPNVEDENQAKLRFITSTEIN